MEWNGREWNGIEKYKCFSWMVPSRMECHWGVSGKGSWSLSRKSSIRIKKLMINLILFF